MHINITLFIQIINFVITYKVLDIFFFKPILASLEQKKEQELALNSAVQQKEHDLENLEEQEKLNFLLFRKK